MIIPKYEVYEGCLEAITGNHCLISCFETRKVHMGIVYGKIEAKKLGTWLPRRRNSYSQHTVLTVPFIPSPGWKEFLRTPAVLLARSPNCESTCSYLRRTEFYPCAPDWMVSTDADAVHFVDHGRFQSFFKLLCSGLFLSDMCILAK